MPNYYESEFCVTCGERFDLEDVITECIYCYNPKEKWISVKDSFPEPGVFVLVSYPKDFNDRLSVGINVYSEKNGWELKHTNAYAAGITHWMPLPSPLNEGKK